MTLVLLGCNFLFNLYKVLVNLCLQLGYLLDVEFEAVYTWLKVKYMLQSWKWLFKNVIPCQLYPAFGVGGDYPQGCSQQLEKINGRKEMRANVKMNLPIELNITFAFFLCGFELVP